MESKKEDKKIEIKKEVNKMESKREDKKIEIKLRGCGAKPGDTVKVLPREEIEKLIEGVDLRDAWMRAWDETTSHYDGYTALNLESGELESFGLSYSESLHALDAQHIILCEISAREHEMMTPERWELIDNYWSELNEIEAYDEALGKYDDREEYVEYLAEEHEEAYKSLVQGAIDDSLSIFDPIAQTDQIKDEQDIQEQLDTFYADYENYENYED